MTLPDLVTAAEDARALAELNEMLESLDAERRAAWALNSLPGQHALATSFGAQSAVSLHLLSRLKPDLPVVLIDTGYLFPETYRFADELRERLGLNLKIYRSQLSPAWQEARYGQLWQQGVSGIDCYNRINKVEPMQRALTDLGVHTWFAGLRRSQASTRANTPVLELKNGRWKFHPLADWSDRDVWRYLTKHDLPYHPLWHQGYVSVGDVHTSAPLGADQSPEDTRFFGLKRECGLHIEV